MRRLAGIVVVIALSAAGCIGSSSSSSPAPSTGHPGIVPPLTDVTITYPAPKSTCPIGGWNCPLTSHDGRIVNRHLTCSPDSGDYEDPTAVCRALADLGTKLDADPTASHVCWCPYIPEPRAKAVGIYEGKRRTIPLDGCSLCGMPGVGADLKLLLPGA
jgi:hypothetical protein